MCLWHNLKEQCLSKSSCVNHNGVVVVVSSSNCGIYHNCLLIPVACLLTSRFFMATVTQFVLQVAEMYKNQQNSVKVSGTDPDPEDFY